MAVKNRVAADGPTRRDAAWLIARALATPAGIALAAEFPLAAQEAEGGMHSQAPPEPDRWRDYQPKFFSAPDFAALQAFASILIPTDDTPGAREAHVAEFTDFVVNAAAEYAPEMQNQWRDAMRWLASNGFTGAPMAQQEALVAAMAAPEEDPHKSHPGYRVFRLIKEMTVRSYYTSRAGLIGNLNYQGYAYLTAFPGCDHPEHQKA